MKKSAIFKTLATIAAMLCLTTFVSCDEEEILSQPVEGPKYVEANIKHTVSLSEDLFSFYDVTATIGISEEDAETIEVDGYEWEYYYTWINAVPSAFFCKVVAKLKESIPEIDSDKEYEFSIAAKSNLQLFDKAGTMSLPELDDISKAVNERMSLPGGKVIECINEYFTDEFVILLSSYTIE